MDYSKDFLIKFLSIKNLHIRILFSILIVILLYFLNKTITNMLSVRIKDVKIRYRYKKILLYIIFIFSFVLIGALWFEESGSLITFFGLSAAGIAIALKDLIINIAAWVFILLKRPFEAGDRIQIGDNSGDVIDIRIFQFTILEIGNWVDADQSTGRIIHIPNSSIFSIPLANYDKGFHFVWNEIPVSITYESNWKKAKSILQDIANEHAEHMSPEAQRKVEAAARRFMIFYSKLTPIVYTDVKSSYITLTIRYLCKPRYRRGSAEKIWEHILEEFAKHNDIDFAYPTQRIYSEIFEGKNANDKDIDIKFSTKK